VAWGGNDRGQCDVPELGGGLTYRQVATGSGHTVLIKSDGTAAAFGMNGNGQCAVPELSDCLTYTYVAAGHAHTVLLRSNGTAVACGNNFDGQCNIPALDGGLSYTQVAAGHRHTLLLRSDGTAVACGKSSWVPPIARRWTDWLPCGRARSPLRYIACPSPLSVTRAGIAAPNQM